MLDTNENIMGMHEKEAWVFRSALVQRKIQNRAVFFIPKKKIDNPFAEIFIPANTGLREFHENDWFIPAVLGINITNEPNIWKSSRGKNTKCGNEYLLQRNY